ncbi:hypothetical protein AAH994_13205 [Weeksellaceae bacterium A-14]
MYSIHVEKKENVEKLKTVRNFPLDSFKNYSFNLLNTDYRFDFETKIFKIDFYKISDSIRLTKEEENQIAREFFENYIDTLKNNNLVRDPEEPLIMPNFGNSFFVYKKGINTSFIRIENGEYKNIDKLSESDKNILNFKNKLLDILHKNKDFKKCLDTLKSVQKYDDRVFI